ncbi:protein MNN4 isoform X2 [Pogonomyrmex barbatus]|uniref:Protein MNN4 isoform X2 n=1 Tax=Pogonomyrmex barbatus TaxID=144034 RepID=A0A8N1S5D1_9HYME|nr:protein MNN4 isoform X2 [Pogonomyrmex barbatus]
MEDFVPTRVSQIKKTTVTNYVSVNYEEPKKKRKPADDADNKEKPEDKKTPAELKEQQEKEMKKLRYEIIKFGAKPPKNRRMNYKALKLRRKKEEEKKKEEGHRISGFVNSLLKPKSKKIRKKDSGILGVYGKVPKNIKLPKEKS